MEKQLEAALQPEQPNPDPVIIQESDCQSETGTTQNLSGSKQHTERKNVGKPGEPDAGEWQFHTVHQGLITVRQDGREKILMPWQVLPFSEGWQLLVKQLSVRFHRGVFQVGSAGNLRLPPGDVRSERVGSVVYARNSWAYVTPADSICGFTGAQFKRSKITCDRVKFVRDVLSRFNESETPWSASVVETIDLRSVLPAFWIELAEPKGGFSPEIPFSKKQDITTGEVVKYLVRLDDWHLLAPIPGITPDVVNLCERMHGDRFMLNRIYLAGTGIGPNQDLRSTDVREDGMSKMLELKDLAESEVGKLASVITPCLIGGDRGSRTHGSKKTKTEFDPMVGDHELFSVPSLNALRNMLGDQAVAGTSVFSV